MTLTLVQKSELLASDAKAVGIWSKEQASEFVEKVEKGEIGEDLFNVMEQDLNEIISLFKKTN